MAEASVTPVVAPSKVIDEKTTRIVVIRLHEIELKITLTAKFLSRPFRDAAVAPFLKAYSKKVDQAATVGDVDAVLIDGLPADMSLPCAELLPIAASALSGIVSPARRLRRKTEIERVEFRVET